MSAEFQVMFAVKILFNDSTGFDEMRWTIVFARETKLMDIVYDLDKDQFKMFTIDGNIY